MPKDPTETRVCMVISVISELTELNGRKLMGRKLKGPKLNGLGLREPAWDDGRIRGKVEQCRAG